MEREGSPSKYLFKESIMNQSLPPTVKVEEQEILPLSKQSTTAEEVKGVTKKIKKPRQQWLPTYKICDVQDPQQISDKDPLAQKKKTKYQYVVKFRYRDDKNVLHSKTMFIGKRGEKYRCSGATEEMSRLQNSRFLKCQNPFHKNYWVVYLLNSGVDIYKNRAEYMRMLQQQ